MKVMTPSFKVKHKTSGLFYRLFPQFHLDKDAYYLACNDGRVPSGQLIIRNEQELDEMFDLARG